MNKFYIIGSINVDFLISVSHLPLPGETIISDAFKQMPGGKGGNQAIALARLGNAVSFFGKVGNDEWGKSYKKIFREEGVVTKYVELTKNSTTGIAVIEVEKNENRIVVIPGANSLVDKAFVDNAVKFISKDKASSKMVLLQLEIPIQSVCYAINELSKIKNLSIVLDPAPAQKLPLTIYKEINFIIPNLIEASILTGIKIDNHRAIYRAIKKLTDIGCKNVIIKAGENGAYYVRDKKLINVPPYKKVKVIDTTGAGDTFNAGFAHAIQQKMSLQKAIEFANIAAGLSISKQGAQSAMPKIKEIKLVLKK